MYHRIVVTDRLISIQHLLHRLDDSLMYILQNWDTNWDVSTWVVDVYCVNITLIPLRHLHWHQSDVDLSRFVDKATNLPIPKKQLHYNKWHKLNTVNVRFLIHQISMWSMIISVVTEIITLRIGFSITWSRSPFEHMGNISLTRWHGICLVA